MERTRLPGYIMPHEVLEHKKDLGRDSTSWIVYTRAKEVRVEERCEEIGEINWDYKSMDYSAGLIRRLGTWIYTIART